MVVAALDMADLISLQTLYHRGLRNNGISLPSIIGNTSLSEIVETPGEDTVLVVDGEAVEEAADDVLDLALWKTEGGWHEGVRAVPVHDAATQLVLLATAPGEGVAAVVEREDVVSAGGEEFDFLELGDEDWGALDVFFLGFVGGYCGCFCEADYAVASL